MATDLPVLPSHDIVRGELLIRRWREADAAALATAIGESADHLRPWMNWVPDEPGKLADALDYIVRVGAGWDEGGDMAFGMFLGPVAVGSCGLHRRRGPRALEIGYWVHVDHIGKGYATAAAAALTSAAFTLPDVDHVEIHHDRANTRSGRVPQKLGYEFVGEEPDEVTAPGEEGVDCTWRIARADWHGEPAWPA